MWSPVGILPFEAVISRRAYLPTFSINPTYMFCGNYTCICCIVYEMQRDIGQKSRIFHTLPVYNAPLRVPHRDFGKLFVKSKLERCGYHVLEKL